LPFDGVLKFYKWILVERGRSLSANSEKVPNSQKTVASEQMKQQLLHKIDRARSRLMVCFYTLPIYMIALVILLNEGRNVTFFMFVYMAVYAVFAIDMVVKSCPSCNKQYFVKSFFLNFFTKKCVHCGMSSRNAQSDVVSQNERKF